MHYEEKIITIRYKVFEVGEKVKPVHPNCLLQAGVYTVTAFVPPTIGSNTAIVFVEGLEIGVLAEDLMPID